MEAAMKAPPSNLRYRVTVTRMHDDPSRDAEFDPLYEGEFNANENTADEIAEMSANCIEEAISCDVTARMDGQQ
jgi:hypothetical protein